MTALVLVPAYTPPLPDDAHLTLVWPGNEVEPYVSSRLKAMMDMFVTQHVAFPAKVMGIAMLGTNRDEPVLLVELTSQLALMRAAVNQYSKSEHKEFRPHVAVPGLGHRIRRGTRLPKHLYFHQVAWWPAQEGYQGSVTKWLGS